LGFTELLAAGALTMKRETLADYGASVHEAAEQAFKLMENLLHWSRLQMDRVSVETVELDLCETVRANIELLAPVAAKKGVELAADTRRPAAAPADGDMMDTILRNLISNAIKFTPSRRPGHRFFGTNWRGMPHPRGRYRRGRAAGPAWQAPVG
jgi:signal transduction histidine kinase